LGTGGAVNFGYLLIFGALLVIGLAAAWGIAAIESNGAKGVLVVLLLVLIVVEKGIFDLMIPAGRDEIIRQNYQCTGADFYNPGCPGYPPPWQDDP
jgi:hypothetical protein